MEVVNLKLITSSSHRFKPNKTRSKIKKKSQAGFRGETQRKTHTILWAKRNRKNKRNNKPKKVMPIKNQTHRQKKKKEIRSRRGQPGQLGVGMVELRQLKGYYYSYLFSAPASGVERHDFYESCAMMFSMILWRLRGVWRETDTHRYRYRQSCNSSSSRSCVCSCTSNCSCSCNYRRKRKDYKL